MGKKLQKLKKSKYWKKSSKNCKKSTKIWKKKLQKLKKNVPKIEPENPIYIFRHDFLLQFQKPFSKSKT